MYGSGSYLRSDAAMNRSPRSNKLKFAINGWFEIVFGIYVSIWKRFIMDVNDFRIVRAYVACFYKKISNFCNNGLPSF